MIVVADLDAYDRQSNKGQKAVEFLANDALQEDEELTDRQRQEMEELCSKLDNTCKWFREDRPVKYVEKDSLPQELVSFRDAEIYASSLSRPTCYNCQQEGRRANECRNPRVKLKTSLPFMRRSRPLEIRLSGPLP